MKKRYYFGYWLLLAILCIGISGCKQLLDEKPDQRLVIPSALGDFQALMDNFGVLTANDLISAEISADDYYLTDADLAALPSEYERRMYSWQKDNLFEPGSNEWAYLYKAVYSCNAVLEGMEASTIERDVKFNNVKGQALVYRAKCFLQGLGVWAKAYQVSSAADLGIPLRPSADFNTPSTRATVQEGYQKVLSDLKAAVPLLPDRALSATRPSKASAYGLLARAFLYMGDYQAAENYADSCLRINGVLLDYNKLNVADRYPIALFNPEVVFNTFVPPSTIVTSTRAKIVPELLQSYHTDDLRKQVFYLQSGGAYYFKGTYFQPALFFGLATDEMFLTLAECQVRNGKTALGIQTLNKLLVARFKAGTFVPLAASDKTTALDMVLTERRKELVMRGMRWMDIKRLNADGGSIVLKRTIGGTVYTLTPNDKRYALPLPEDIIALTGMPQNER
ncbi:RagB/SusD family nutrient uptake outer membrane protein [Pedobacter riviphilus]|uniref:RagB/SusD family nutrient uptake outer membrane protein n=1 Tax=Pedobacter riviphilus TaxID=2766984 RepID=A0ABX6TE49_9SPHI|nr:RagB/SusD family nutrient uptake outer membrane protein [Pedobacter riviphilus]QNR82902.1 RagB/SusD family nutrient uptake outer membrane protein [Pedobacter riviphilus]